MPSSTTPSDALRYAHGDGGEFVPSHRREEISELQDEPLLAAAHDQSTSEDLTPLPDASVSEKERGNRIGVDPAVDAALESRSVRIAVPSSILTR